MADKEGWSLKVPSIKYHYYIDGWSLCGRWFYSGNELELGNNESPDNCAECRRKIMQRKGR